MDLPSSSAFTTSSSQTSVVADLKRLYDILNSNSSSSSSTRMVKRQLHSMLGIYGPSPPAPSQAQSANGAGGISGYHYTPLDRNTTLSRCVGMVRHWWYAERLIVWCKMPLQIQHGQDLHAGGALGYHDSCTTLASSVTAAQGEANQYVLRGYPG
ncbi:hypothetical protein HDU88_000639 [Geranomyces variabilis]|nr:hypothetical protein HDU88_000639 [Geranomyces variabilis]